MSEKFLTDLIKENVEGFEYRVPKEKYEWLDYRYGKNWNIPESKKMIGK